jgi:hypothetical protein
MRLRTSKCNLRMNPIPPVTMRIARMMSRAGLSPIFKP